MSRARDRGNAERHESAASAHDAAMERHEQAARFWDGHDDVEMAAMERRGADLERELARYERDRAQLMRSRAAP